MQSILFGKCLNKLINKHNNALYDCNMFLKLSQMFDTPAELHTVAGKPFYISVPFISHTQKKTILKKNLKYFIGQIYHQLDMKIFFYNRLT